MQNQIEKYNIFWAIIIIVGIPLLFYVLGDFPRKTLLKESISVLFIVAFCLISGQFFLTRSNRSILKVHKMFRVMKLHKYIGYVVAGILLIHPFLIVVPRYFEAGVDPKDAFTTLITIFSSTGVILGISAWTLIFVIGFTSYFRNNLGIRYKTWRVLHGILSVVFIILAS